MDVVIVSCAMAVMVGFLVIVRRLEATITKPLPALDHTPRTATVVGVRSDSWLIEVEYDDGTGARRREFLADRVYGIDEFAPGTRWQVYGFAKPRGRCLLTEAHDEVLRFGYDLDGLRLRKERAVFDARRGSPIIGVMPFVSGTLGACQRIPGRRTSWPGDPARAWRDADGGAPLLVRPRRVPPVTRDGVLCDSYDSPLTFPGGEVSSDTTILVDVHVPDEQAARIVAALRAWASHPAARDAWGPQPLCVFYRTITSAELFGPSAAGGFIARDCVGEPGDWVLVSEAQDDEYPDAPFRRAELTLVAAPRAKRRSRRDRPR